MTCPRCETSGLDERERDGVIIDACPSCRGIWLDRGELEKLIARERAYELLDDRDDPRDAPRGLRSGDRYPRGDERREDERRYDGDDRHRPRRRKSFLDTLGDIFD